MAEQKHDLQKKRLAICAHIRDAWDGRGYCHIEYEFTYKGKKFVTTEDCTYDNYQRFKNGGYAVWVVFNPDFPYETTPLETDKDFKDYHIIPSDTAGLRCPRPE